MKKRVLQGILLFSLLGLVFFQLAAFQAGSPATETTVLYDGALGGTPGSQGFTYFAFGSQAAESFADGVTTLDTTGDLGDQAGYSARDFPVLDRQEGFSVTLTSQLTEEIHTSQHRAGFSLIVLSTDRLGIELAFWTNEIWAQRGPEGTMFTHAERAAYDTTAALTTYELRIFEDSYTLLVGEEAILSGPLRDYSSFTGFPNPYVTPNFIFIGDNTTRAGAVVDIAYMALETTAEATSTPTATATATNTPRPTIISTDKPSPTASPMATNTSQATNTPGSAPPTETPLPPTPTPEATRGPFWWLPCINN